MTSKVKTIALILFFQINLVSHSQDICVPVFYTNSSDTDNRITLSDYFLSKFHSNFFNYFGTICNQYYDVIKFRINQALEVTDIKFNATNPHIQNFIKETLVSTNGKWELSLCDENVTSKEIEMPLYFMFTDPCGTIMKMTYYTDTIPQNIMPLSIDGLKIQSVSEDKITLWPIKIQGPFIQKNILKKN